MEKMVDVSSSSIEKEVVIVEVAMVRNDTHVLGN